MKDTYYKRKQGEKQALLIEQESLVFYGAKNRGLASWSQGKEIKEKESRKTLQSSDRDKNLYEPIRKDVISYMNENHISWWHMVKESDSEVSANTLSSQVSCLNHLFAIRKDESAIKAMLKEATDIEFNEILNSFIDKDTLISFEFVYQNKFLLDETHETRGKKCTSIDAMIYARKEDEKWLIPIEWKYTEAYDENDSTYTNYDRYVNMVLPSSRLHSWSELYRKDPFYELGRQVLLMDKITEPHRIADKFFHIVVVPRANKEMMADAEIFGDLLKDECKKLYRIIDPSDLLSPLESSYNDLINYLRIRYWD